ncbi:hypothetical protein CLAIMM_01225 [Cladophialophora immunda]|nr:hypothetical protein CLAIMM_01225 [Cladophialophora immunda]
MDTLYVHATIITIDADRRVFRDGAILVSGSRLAAIDTTATLDAATHPAVPRVDLEQKIVIPGLINSHIHLIQSLMRGLGEDLNLHEWASCTIWPLEVNYVGDDGYVAAKLAMAEMIKSGTTCFLEPMLPASAGFPGIVRAVDETGIRGCLGKLVKGPKSNISAGISDARDEQSHLMTIDAAIEAHKSFHGACDGRLHVWMATETPRGQDEAGFAAIGKACLDHDIHLTVHCSEAPRDFEMLSEAYGTTPGQFCQRIHATGPHVVLGHMTHVDAQVDLEILRITGTSVAHNPTSNAKLADGICPVPQMLDAGINVCLGSDGAPCNNSHDLFRDMHLAGIIHKATTNNANVLPAEQILEMATINAAKALGVDKEIGSLEVGKKADFVVVDPSGLHAAPYDPAQVDTMGGVHPSTVVVHSCSGRDVTMVVINGDVVVEDGRFTRLDEEQVKSAARNAIAGIRTRSQVKAQPLKRNWHYV